MDFPRKQRMKKSFADFVVKENKVYYALAAIKAVGYDSIKQIITERKKNGPFKSLEDFILRIDSKLINKLQMEGLIKSGTFDCLDSNRKLDRKSTRLNSSYRT